MTHNQIKEAIAKYRDRFQLKKVKDGYFPHEEKNPSKQDVLEHCLGMLDSMEQFVDEERIEKAMRWLGFLQGCLWSIGEFSLEELKSHNRSAKKEKP